MTEEVTHAQIYERLLAVETKVDTIDKNTKGLVEAIKALDGAFKVLNLVAYKATKDAEQAKSVRASRDAKLAETDWRFRSDMTPSQEWKNYCQALRDVPSQDGFPWTITWPEMP